MGQHLTEGDSAETILAVLDEAIENMAAVSGGRLYKLQLPAWAWDTMENSGLEGWAQLKVEGRVEPAA